MLSGVADIVRAKGLGISLKLSLAVFAGFAVFLSGAATDVVKKAGLFVFLDVDRGLELLKLLVEAFEIDFFLLGAILLGMRLSGHFAL